MSNIAFYILALIAIAVAVMVMKHVVTCLMRSVVLVVLIVVLAITYYIFIGQYDPEIHDAVEKALHL